MDKQNRDKKISLEIIRFLITGIVCAIADFLTSFGVKEALFALEIEWLKIAIYTFCGFIIGVILNYFLSTYWVFKNVKDKKKTKTAGFIALYVLLSAIGWGLSYGTMQLCTIAFNTWAGVDISESLINQGLTFDLLLTAHFWLYVLAFGLKTFVGMVWNYLTRKFILYKAPKEGEEIKEGASNEQ